MKAGYKRWYSRVLLVCMFLLVPGGSSFGEEAKVVFECGDIGVEARRVLSELKEERERLAEREKLLTRRENELKILEQEVDEKLKRMKQQRNELESMLAKKDQVEGERLKKLSKIYQKRNPAGAAASLAAMDKNLAVSILSLMRDKYAGEILDNMAKETAVIYSTALGHLDR